MLATGGGALVWWMIDFYRLITGRMTDVDGNKLTLLGNRKNIAHKQNKAPSHKKSIDDSSGFKRIVFDFVQELQRGLLPKKRKNRYIDFLKFKKEVEKEKTTLMNANSSKMNISYTTTIKSLFDLSQYDIAMSCIIFGAEFGDIEIFDFSNEQVEVSYAEIEKNQWGFSITGYIDLEELEDLEKSERDMINAALRSSKSGAQVFIDIEIRENGDSEALNLGSDYEVGTNLGTVFL